MRAVITRVSHASVSVEGEVIGSIDAPSTGGLLVLLGVSREDLEEWEPRAEKMARKIAELRILDGETSVSEAHAPSSSSASSPSMAVPPRAGDPRGLMPRRERQPSPSSTPSLQRCVRVLSPWLKGSSAH